MACAYTTIASIIAYGACIGPSKLSISYNISAAMSCPAAVRYRNSQIRRFNVLSCQCRSL